jgi:hypothetical protein
LREDLDFFERMVPASANSGISIRSFSLQRDSATSIRYRLLVSHGARAGREFSGNVQLVVSALQEGRPVTFNLPDHQPGKNPGLAVSAAPPDPKAFVLAFRTFQRMEGTIPLPPDWVLKSVQAKVLENGILRAQQSASLAH